tara:strand:+ start:540 stop:734 length:195 start_codon:yes stop_codon:yes gene_type:complete
MKFKIPLIAIIIVAAICFINKEEIKNMFNGDQPAICEVCEPECPCPEVDCICDVEICKCEKCVS